MTTKIKTLLVASLACVAIGSYSITSAHEPSVGDRSVPMTGGISVEPTEPNFIMPSPVHVFTTVKEAAEYMNITPQMPKLLPVGFNIQSVITIDKDIVLHRLRLLVEQPQCQHKRKLLFQHLRESELH